jgi:hypothetical protein
LEKVNNTHLSFVTSMQEFAKSTPGAGLMHSNVEDGIDPLATVDGATQTAADCSGQAHLDYPVKTWTR